VETVQMRSVRLWFAFIGIAAATVSGCAPTTSFDRDFVSAELDSRAGSALPETPPRQDSDFPPQVTIDDGLDEDESVAVALWNNAAFHSDLADLGIARGDLVEAGLLPNPVLSLVFPGVGSTRSGTLSMPVRVLQRPARIAIATLDAERIAHSLLQSGLGLARDVRIAFAELSFARDREALARRAAAVLNEVRQITAAQLDAGGISELEAARIEGEALEATATLQTAMRETAAAQYRFLGLLGLTDAGEIPLRSRTAEGAQLPAVAALIDVALTSRPDLRAAELAVEAAGESAKWERQQTYDFIALLDLDEPAGEDLATGPGVEFELPLFDRNQGGRLRAAARIEQTSLRYLETRRAVVLGVRESHAAYQAALDAEAVWRREILPRAGANALGSISDLAVLQAEQRALGARIAAADARRELLRASAALAYSVGRKVEGQL
jgi:cobalt-zinc-cadmium efflux system outer membrane protein